MPHSWFSPWTPFRGVEGQQLEWPWFNFCRRRWQVSVFSWQSPFLLIWPWFWGGHFMTILSHGAENVHSQVWQRFCWQATQCAVTGLGYKTVSKILWPTCLTSLLLQDNIPSYCFFPYPELHCYHLDLIWNYILFYQRPQSHIWRYKKQQFYKTGEINNIASSISKLTSKT